MADALLKRAPRVGKRVLTLARSMSRRPARSDEAIYRAVPRCPPRSSIASRPARSGRAPLGHRAVVHAFPFVAFNPATSGLFRVGGLASCRGAVRPWSCILKIANTPPEPSGPADWNWWRRETLAYRLGLLDRLPASIRAPRCFAALEPPGASWLFLEEIHDAAPGRWSATQHARAARHLGQLNGAFVGRVPHQRWLNRRFLSRVAEGRDQWLPFLRATSVRRHPLFRRAFPRSPEPDVTRLYRDAGPLLDALDALPQTLCHFDAYRSNLFASHDPRTTIAIDWSFIGAGAVGTDLGQLVANNLMWLLAPRDPLGTAFTPYLRGLRQGGHHHGPAAEVRFAYVASAALRGALALPLLLSLLVTPASRPLWVDRFGPDVETSAARWGRAMTALLSLGDTARRLAPQ